jgi:YidC/Oxa1 family membrane protein insertase
MPFVLANIFQPLIDVFDAIIRFFHDTVGIGWGLSIIALTVVVRIVLIPLTIKQFRSMAALQQLAPEIKALQEKYKEDKQRLNQEMMKFYQENKVNPFGSCLPLLLQMPVFLSLFYMLRKDLKVDICGPALRAAGKVTTKAIQNTGCGDLPGSKDAAQFLFIHDLTSKATGAVLITLIVLYVGSQLASSLLMSVTADKNQRLLMLALPFMFVLFIQGFPAGLIVYWITTNIWTVGQQYMVRRHITHPPGGHPPRPGAAVAVAAGAGGAPSGRDGGSGKAPKGAKEDAGEKVAAGSKAAPPPPPRKKKKRSGRRR